MELRRAKDAAARPSRRENDTVGWYLNRIKDHEVLKHERVVELFKRYEAGDKAAMNEIVTRNLKLVVAVARAYRDKGVDWEDLLQEGNLGLIHAIEKFDWRRGNRFSTYACVPVSTQILTRTGWKRHDELVDDDETLGYRDGCLEWTPVHGKATYKDAELLRFGDGKWSAVCTPNHKWVMEDETGASLRPIEEWPEAKLYETVKRGSKRPKFNLVLSAPYVGGTSSLTEDEAALLAWVHSDGTIIRRLGSPEIIDGAQIFQSKKKFAKEVKELLERLGAFVSERKHNKKGSCSSFFVRATIFQSIWKKAGLHERSLWDLVIDLRPEARAAFNAAWYAADGSQGKGNITDGNGPKLDAFELSLFLEGKNCLRRRARKDANASVLSWREKRLTPRRCVVTKEGKGDVWCPNTGLGSWVARAEDGSVFLTGNTWWIRQRISHYLSTQRHSIRVPTHALRLKKHIESTIEAMKKSGVQEPSWEAIAEVVGGSADVVEATVAGSRATVSLSQPAISTEREALEGRFRNDDDAPDALDPERPLALAQLKEAIVGALGMLDPIDRRIVELRVKRRFK